jgi:hypothetical protein
MLCLLLDQHDPEVNAAELEERSQSIADAKDAWYERGIEDFRAHLDVEAIVERFASGHPALDHAYREGWAVAAIEEAL